MGYGMIVPPESAAVLRMHLHLANVKLARSRWPWDESRRAKEAYARRWKARDWQSWLDQTVELPLEVLVMLPNRGPRVVQIREMIPQSRTTAEKMGVYFATMVDGEALVFGGTTIMPLDVDTRSAEAFAEYHAYRQLAGPPPGMRSAPKFMEFGPGS